MLSITLSDYTSDRLAQIQKAKGDHFQERLDRYAIKKEEIEAERQSILLERERKSEARRRLFKEGKYVRWFFSCLFLPLELMFREALPAEPKEPRWDYYETSDEAKLKAGNEGENMIDALFAPTPNSFTMIAGYKNYKGEIDRVVVCPIGILAIEVKNYNGSFTINGDYWGYDKYDKYGNLKETNLRITEQGGRSPSEQVNQSADILQRFLAQRHPKIKRVARAVFFTHLKAQVVEVRNQTVDVIAHSKTAKWTNGIENIMPNKDDRLSVLEIQEIVGTIKKDHEFHAKRKEERDRKKEAETAQLERK